MKKQILLLFSFVFALAAKAQQDPQYNLYQFNQMVINPAYAGARDGLSVVASVRNQWAGFKGAPTTSNLTTQEFTVYYSENRTFEAVVTMYQFNTSSLDGVLESISTEQEFDGLLSTNLTQQNLTNVPYQFLVGSRLYQLSKNSATTNGYLFDDKTSKNVWRVCKLTPINALSDYLLPSETIENIWVRTKKYTKPTNTNLTITFYELKIGDNNDNSYIGVPESQTTTYPTPGEDMEFNREQI